MSISRSMVAPMDSAVAVAILRISSCARNRHVSSSARSVPIIFTSLGITFVVYPPWIEEMVSTDGESGSLFLLMICCSATTICDATSTVSVVRCGAAACPPLPYTVIKISSALAITLPPRKLKVPTGSPGCTCKPKMADGSGFFSTPSFIRILAPPGFLSSPG